MEHPEHIKQIKDSLASIEKNVETNTGRIGKIEEHQIEHNKAEQQAKKDALQAEIDELRYKRKVQERIDAKQAELLTIKSLGVEDTI